MRTCQHTGGELPANLYNDPRGRSTHYRYKKPDGKFNTFKATYSEAVAKAAKANSVRGVVPTNRYSLGFWSGEFLEHLESQNPELVAKKGWKDRRHYVELFAQQFGHTRTDQITIAILSPWWDSLSFDVQHNRRSILSKFFIYMMGRGVVAANPFNTNDHEAHLLKKSKPQKSRLPLHESEFWEVYEHADEHVRAAMAISLATTLRRGDVVNLRFDAIVDGELRVTVGKSVGQRGFARASHLAWPLEDHPALRDAINAARERSLTLRRCPFIVAHAKHFRGNGGGLAHEYQCTPEAISRGFARAVKASGLWDKLPAGKRPPTFHEVRGLAIERMIAAGEDIRTVQHLAAHTDESITSGYAANHDPEFETVRVATPVKMR